MESLLSLLLLVLVSLFYFSGRHNTVNRWSAFAGFLFWLGLGKEAIAYNLIPFWENALGVENLARYFLIPYAWMTWALYALAVPTAILFSLTIGGQLPTPVRRLPFYLPAAVVSCVFYPWQFHIYQQGNVAFWGTFTAYNLLGCAIYAVLTIRAVTRETERTAKRQKKLVASVVLPPVLFWAVSVFPSHLLQLTNMNKLWQLNSFILLGCIAFYIAVAFRGGMMGLRLTGESYRWNSDMGLIRRGASYTAHMIKNQTAKMTMCVENLKAHFDAQENPPPEELAILSRAIRTLEAYSEKSARYADAIVLEEGAYSLDEMLHDAFSFCARSSQPGASLSLTGVGGIDWYCDQMHMTEAFLNLFANALDAMGSSAVIEVSATQERENAAFVLYIADRGRGMRPEDTARLFDPYFTTKNSPHNLGLGLAYCKNVIQKHGGTLKARSNLGKGTTMIIRLPGSRILPKRAESGRCDAPCLIRTK